MKIKTKGKVPVAAIFLALTGIIIFASAGSSRGQGQSQNIPAAASGPGFSRDNNPGIIGRTAADGTRFDSQNNPGNTGNVFGQATAADASSNRDSGTGGSGNGSAASSNASANAFTHANDNAVFNRTGGRGEEMVVSHSRKEGGKENVRSAGASADKGTSEKAEHNPTFDDSALFAGINPIPSATPSRGVNPVPSASPAGRPDENPRVSPIPSATPGGRPAGVPGVSPIPSAPQSKGINPVPSATVSSHN
ncbi:MAG: hypothetical protein QOE73_452 [Verrucomicrobiota bacterium]|jgi:hypothetical protein